MTVGRLYVLPDDVKYLAPLVMKHRLIVSGSARNRELTAEQVIRTVIEDTPIPERPFQK